MGTGESVLQVEACLGSLGCKDWCFSRPQFLPPRSMNCLRRYDAVSISVAVVLATRRFWKVTIPFVLVEAVDTVAVDTLVAGATETENLDRVHHFTISRILQDDSTFN